MQEKNIDFIRKQHRFTSQLCLVMAVVVFVMGCGFVYRIIMDYVEGIDAANALNNMGISNNAKSVLVDELIFSLSSIVLVCAVLIFIISIIYKNSKMICMLACEKKEKEE